MARYGLWSRSLADPDGDGYGNQVTALYNFSSGGRCFSKACETFVRAFEVAAEQSRAEAFKDLGIASGVLLILSWAFCRVCIRLGNERKGTDCGRYHTIPWHWELVYVD